MSERTYNIILVVLIAIACVIVGALLYLIYDSTVSPPATATVMPTPTATTPPTVTDSAWNRIQQSGKMIAGTSADYPPFAFRTEDFQLDGLDIAVINEVGRRLGLEVEIQDMAFDGLNWALELEQIDVAIAALSVTPEREASIDFSDIYFVSEDAVLANSSADIPPINSIEDLTNYRIGVQRTTVYSNWVYETLVEPGLMPINQVQAYENIENAVRDLRQGLIDIVILDLPPAQVAVAQGGIKIIGQGLNKQFFAIGIPKGEPVLEGEINNALAQMQSDGTLGSLVQKYMGVTPPPLPTPVPTLDPSQPTPTPQITATPASCVDGMKFVDDINLDDNKMTSPPVMPPGQSFRKGWRIQNSGTCTWNSSYRLVYDGGNSPAASMGGQPTPIFGSVPPGAEYDIFVDLVAPVAPGVYQGFWVMHNGQDQKFGERIWVGITVPRPPTPTPPPTQTPSPGINFQVDRNRIFAGECVLFSWNVTNVKAVYFYQQGQPWQQYPVPAQGSRTECPPVTTTYELRVVKPDDTVEVRQITVFVEPVPGAPIIDRFTVDPPYQINLGQCVDISWSVTGNVTTVKLLRGQTILRDGAPVSGTMNDCPPSGGQVTYTIEAAGPGGTSRLQRTITVVVPQVTSTPTRVPTITVTPVTPTPIPPVIYSFTVNPNEIQTGESITLAWQVGGEVSKIQLKRDGVVILDNAPFNGTAVDTLDSAGIFTYLLEATGINGDIKSAQQIVTVTEPTTSLPLVGTNWQLESYYDGIGAQVLVLPGSTVSAVFDSEGQVTGESGCNTYSATYSSAGAALTVDTPDVTFQLCQQPSGVMEQEQAYLTILPEAAVYEISSSNLTVKNSSDTVILRYVALVPTPKQ